MGREKIINGFSLIEIIVAMTIFFIIFAGIASVYTVGMALETRTELNTSAEYIAQFLLEYFMALGPDYILEKPDPDGSGITARIIKNLPPPVGGYEVMENPDSFPGNNLIDKIYNYATDKGSFIELNPPTLGYFESEWAPHPDYFPNIFALEGYKTLPDGFYAENRTIDKGPYNINSLLPETITFINTNVSDPTYKVVINSFPPFMTLGSPNLQYKLKVICKEFFYIMTEEGYIDTMEEYEVIITVKWQIKGNPYEYSVRGTVIY